MKRFAALLATVILLFSAACAESATAVLQEMYTQGELLMVQGDYAGAAARFESLGTYSDASQMTMYCKAIAAAEMLGLHSMAVDAFTDLGDFKDSKQMAKYYEGRAYEAAGMIDGAAASDSALAIAIGHLEEAEKVYGGLAFFKDSLTRMAACGNKATELRNEQNQRASERQEATYQEALTQEQSGDYTGAIKLYKSIQEYRDSGERIALCETAILDGKYDAAVALMDAGEYSEAITAFEAIRSHRDSAEKIKACKTAILDGKYDAAVALMDAGKYSEAIEAFKPIKNHRDSAAKIDECQTTIADGKYDAAAALMDAGKYSEAYEAFRTLSWYRDSRERANTCYMKAKREELAQVTVGDHVTFGTYEQDSNKDNGAEDIEWLVLARENNRLLVISRYALDYKPYNKNSKSVTWETSLMRTWLNEDFLNDAFISAEQAMIPTVTVSADKNPSYGTNPGNATQDKVFLLSITDVNKYFQMDSELQCKPTAHVVTRGAYKNEDGFTLWLLRTHGCKQSYVAFVSVNGVVDADGTYVDLGSNYVVRPALWINLEPDESTQAIN